MIVNTNKTRDIFKEDFTEAEVLASMKSLAILLSNDDKNLKDWQRRHISTLNKLLSCIDLEERKDND